MTYPGGGQGGWGDQSGQGGWEQSDYGTDRYPTTGGFPQQGFSGSYGGLGVFSGGEEPPKKSNKKLWLIIGVVALVLLVAGGITTLLIVNKSDDQQQVATSTSETPPASSEEPTPTTSAPTKASDCTPRKAGMTCVSTSLGYNYDVPKGWELSEEKLPIPSMTGVNLTGVSSYGAYDCEGKGYTKGTNGGTLLDKGDINKIASDFAKAIATDYYSGAPTNNVTVGQPKAVKFPHKTKDGKDIVVEGVQVDATAATSGNKCLASKGVVKVLLLVGTTKFHALVVNGDLEGGGGGTNPPLPKESELQDMINSLTPTS